MISTKSQSNSSWPVQLHPSIHLGMDFCNDNLVPSGVRITDPAELKWAHMALWETLGMKPSLQNPSAPTAQPVSLHRHEMEQLTTESDRGGVKASLKADGVRFLVLLTQWPISLVEEREERCVALMYDRALVPYEVGLWAQPRYFEKRTLLDGELVQRVGGSESHDLLWLAFDVIMEAGKRVDHLTYDKRLNRLHAMLDSIDEPNLSVADQVTDHGKIIVTNHDCSLKLMVKPYVDMPDVRSLWEARHNAGFRYDGILFTPVAQAARFGKHTSMFKWKSRHTIDVWVGRKIKRERDTNSRSWTIKVMCRRQMMTVSEEAPALITVETGRIHLKLVDTFTLDSIMDCPNTDGLVLECSMQVHLDRGVVELFPIRHRTDKTHPNSVVTIESTIENVMDHITVEDLIHTIEGVDQKKH